MLERECDTANDSKLFRWATTRVGGWLLESGATPSDNRRPLLQRVRRQCADDIDRDEVPALPVRCCVIEHIHEGVENRRLSRSWYM